MNQRKVLSQILGLTGAGMFAAAVWGLHHDIEPFATWFYSLAWWSYILLADAVIFARQGNSLLMNRLSELPKLALASVTCWLIFEIVNFSLGNWHYLGVPRALFGAGWGMAWLLPRSCRGCFRPETSWPLSAFSPRSGDRRASRGQPGCRRPPLPVWSCSCFLSCGPAIPSPCPGWPSFFSWTRCVMWGAGPHCGPIGAAVPAAGGLPAAAGRSDLRLFLGILELLGQGQMDIYSALFAFRQDF